MKLIILAIGKGRNAAEHQLAEAFISRLPAGGDIIEVESKLPAGPKRQTDESALLMQRVPDNAILVALDPRGKDTSSEKLAAALEEWRDSGHGVIYFAIGGADGHSQNLRDRAEMIMSFGTATWPHMLFRAMLAEQLYRATSILSGHPYHRGN
ncbi:23S rRNA (pseudouridine(1915)-N(3))-methyltransferase RlmH [Alphaproteobacteria bacterium]|nr:23S rRNA (pseudouridine(1915)-N(3))-methyltransferase RlmH [Alphaproteobacteria bacterium]